MSSREPLVAHLLDSTQYWRKVGEFSRDDLHELCEAPRSLWFNGSHSSKGLNDEVPVAEAQQLHASLVLLEPDRLLLEVAQGMHKPQVRARFRVAGVEYNFVVTDPATERAFLPRGIGQYPYGRPAVVCVSLGEPLGGYRYKLVASVIDL